MVFLMERERERENEKEPEWLGVWMAMVKAEETLKELRMVPVS
jgi:hypothetical protein